jgi:hypothetical protein
MTLFSTTIAAAKAFNALYERSVFSYNAAQLSEPVEPGMGQFGYPPTSLECRVILDQLLLLSSGADVGHETIGYDHLFFPDTCSVQA